MNLCVKNGKLVKIQKESRTPMKKINKYENYKGGDGDGEYGESDDEGNENAYDATTKEEIDTNSQEYKREQKLRLFKRTVWLEQLQKEAQIRRINAVKTKRLSFINTNDISLVAGPQSNTLNKTFSLLGK